MPWAVPALQTRIPQFLAQQWTLTLAVRELKQGGYSQINLWPCLPLGTISETAEMKIWSLQRQQWCIMGVMDTCMDSVQDCTTPWKEIMDFCEFTAFNKHASKQIANYLWTSYVPVLCYTERFIIHYMDHTFAHITGYGYAFLLIFLEQTCII